MRIISCHIENFGKLHNYDYQFDSLNVIHEENGWGKTTLATFIRVMFYGFSGENKRTIVDNERKKYSPWQMGTYGGNIVFAVDEREFRLERIFGSKKNEDGFELYNNKTNLKCDDYSDNIGEELFGINMESFMRTVFIAQQDCGTEVTSEINAQIGNVSDQTADLGKYDEVQEILKDEMNSLSPRRKTGLLKKLSSEIDELKEQIRNKSSYEEHMEALNKNLEDLKKEKTEKKNELKVVQDEIKKVSDVKDSAGLIKEYEGLCESEKEELDNYNDKRAFFVRDLPEKNILESMTKKGEDYENCLKNMDIYKLTGEEETNYEKYRKQFIDGIPEDTVLTEIDNKIGEIGQLKSQRNNKMLSDVEKSKLEKGKALFASYLPTKEEIEEMTEKWTERKSKKDALATKKASADLYKQTSKNNPPKSTAATVFIVLALVAIIGGLGLFLAKQPIIISAVSVIAGIVLLIVGLLQFTKNKSEDDGVSHNDGYNSMIKDIREDESFIEETEFQIKELFEKLGITYSEYSVLKELNTIRVTLNDYNDLLERNAGSEEGDLVNKISGLESECKEFFGKYSVDKETSEFGKLLFDLQNMVTDYNQLINKIKKYNELKEEAETLKSDIVEYIMNLGFEVNDNLRGQLKTIEDNLRDVSNAENQLEKANTKKKQFEEKNDIKSLREKQKELDQSVSMEELNGKFNTINEEVEKIAQDEKNFSDDLERVRENLEELEMAESKLNNLKEEYDRANKKYNIIEKTSAYLEKAKEKFTEEYTEDILAAFEKYHRIISGTDKKYFMDINLNVKLEEKGQLRDVDILSEGYQDLVGLCRRMAFVDAMYDYEKPFLILDDPFVNLDETRVDGAMNFLQKISEDYQIIYFTCHKSRSL